MLHGVLNMPPELWNDQSPIDVMQRHSRYVQASQYIDELDAELTAAREEIAILKSKYADHHSEAERITSEIRAVTAQRDEWKANHDNQVSINQLLRDRPDLKDRAASVDKLIEQLDNIDSMYHKVIKEVLKCDPIPACKREDDQLEPPWEVIARIREQRDRLAEALENCREDSIELLGERDWWQLENRCRYQERYQTTRDNVTRADAALQSLIKP